MALFMCKRSYKEPAVRRGKRFTVKEIEPFLTIEYRCGTSDAGLLCAVLGVAIQKENGSWGIHELSDETDAGLSWQLCDSVTLAEQLKNRVAAQMKKRLVEALNRLREHYERVYVYPTGAERRPSPPGVPG